ncbi:trehalose-phosphatase [Breoghania sp. L-A4]|uniref:trehalose-phosphatase n=1 Tax=Breoghania sp. L-A4 TaxID=2304600 RepID=UPI000E360A85|nr:trehalose-phosphatase [Breoghania sp. L-A4]AXS41962.1 trehalose-phosphatase [Breoghania sp. L-A4]
MGSPPLLAPNAALFLDFDGTLVDIAPTPASIHIPEKLSSLLEDLIAAFDGAVALITGRPLSEVDGFLAPLKLPAAGLHGLERRMESDEAIERVETGPELNTLRERIAGARLLDDAVQLEDKGLALAVHYRQAPERGPDIAAGLAAASADLPSLHMIHGKMVVELKSGAQDKGRALAAFMELVPFAGRYPVFVGDDVTDEDGFAAAARLGGFGVKVGAGETCAAYRLAGIEAVRGWLESAVRHVGRLEASQPYPLDKDHKMDVKP